MDKRLTIWILVGMILGVIVGYFINLHYSNKIEGAIAEVANTKDPIGMLRAIMLAIDYSEALKTAVAWLKLPTDIFLSLIKMVVAPLILSTIVVGIAHMGDSSALGRIGFRAITWFILASLISISLGLVLVNLFQPGLGQHFVASGDIGEVQKLDAIEFIHHIFPKNVFESMASGNILQILVFSLFAGVALSAIGEKGKPLVRGAEALADMMLQITGYVMRLAPLAVFGALAGVIATYGLKILETYAWLVFDFYVGIIILWVILLGLGAIFLRNRIWTLIRYIREPLLIAFSTASSEAAMPKLFEQLDRFGVPRRISGFMLPMGYSFNLDGSMMYSSFATIFIAQAYGIHLPWGTQFAMLLTLMISSKGIAAVPRASLVVITATLAQFGLPVEGVALILGIDVFLDMGRTATNVVGNAVATSVITQWEGMLEEPEPEFVGHPHAPAHTPAAGKARLDLDKDA